MRFRRRAAIAIVRIIVTPYAITSPPLIFSLFFATLMSREDDAALRCCAAAMRASMRAAAHSADIFHYHLIFAITPPAPFDCLPISYSLRH
jgi:hypothetical protein